MRKVIELFFLTVVAAVLLGCSGLRYSETMPEAKDFHPKSIGIFPVDLNKNEEARGVVDKIIADALVSKKWFDMVVTVDDVNRRMESDEGLRKDIGDYLSKLNTLAFSDPQLSQKIGNALHVEAMLIVRVDYWFYTKNKDDHIAKTGLRMRLVSTQTGAVLWKAGHDEARSYTLFKPTLPKVARDVVYQMISRMPH